MKKEAEMAKYLIIATRDPFEFRDAESCYHAAMALVKDGNPVTLFLVQNGVMPARKSTRSDRLSALADAGVDVLADDFSLRERGIAGDRLARGVKAAPIEVVVDQLADGRKALWH
jgi:sulfur relay (sulfurtransferase) complex TusBCD TusD component (DsrE family)